MIRALERVGGKKKKKKDKKEKDAYICTICKTVSDTREECCGKTMVKRYKYLYKLTNIEV